MFLSLALVSKPEGVSFTGSSFRARVGFFYGLWFLNKGEFL